MSLTIKQEIKALVIARLQTLPDGVVVSIGSDGDFTKEELIKRVEKGDKVGKKIMEVEMDFLRSFKRGLFYEH